MSGGAPARMVQLDGLRGIAVILVVFHHWTSWGQALNLGNIGVQLFFVISGFLITGILLEARAKAVPGKRMSETFREFQLNRIARIWPIYMLVLAGVTFAGSRFEHPEAMPMHFLFLSNLLFAIRGEFGTSLSHFWSLCVEQQFYLIWPFAVFLVEKPRLEVVTLSLITVAPLFRLTMVLLGFTDFASFNTLPFASMDSLGMGALIAIWAHMPADDRALRARLLSRLAAIAALAFIGLRATRIDTFNAEQTLYAIVFAWIVMRAREGFKGPAGLLLQFRPLLAVGIVSYGVYVYHMFVPRAVNTVLRAVQATSVIQEGVMLFLLSATLTFALAAASWFLIERPVINFRSSLRRQRCAHAD